MYIPSAFAVTDQSLFIDFIRTNSFATLVSQNENEPQATHLPLLIDENESDTESGKLILTGHMARANPHWKLADESDVLAIFQGPHSYISAAWYGEQNTVPTWNYVAVHVYGRLNIIEDHSRVLTLLEQAAEQFEGEGPNPWSTAIPEKQLIDKLLNAITAFEIEVSRVEGCWKLNQHHPKERRQLTIKSLRDRGQTFDNEIADLMQQFGD